MFPAGAARSDRRSATSGTRWPTNIKVESFGPDTMYGIQFHIQRGYQSRIMTLLPPLTFSFPLHFYNAKTIFPSGLVSNPYASAAPVPSYLEYPCPPTPSFESSDAYGSFFDRLRSGTTSTARVQIPPSSFHFSFTGPVPLLDDILMQPPPPGHLLFSPASSDIAVPLVHDNPVPYTSLLPTFGQFTLSENFTFSMNPPQTPPKRKGRAPGLPHDTPSPHAGPDIDWSIGELLYHVFLRKDDNTHQSQRHRLIVQNFLAGKSVRTVSHIIHAWMTSPYGRGRDEELLFETKIPYLDIGPACGKFLGSESKGAVKPAGGLHAIITAEPVSEMESDGDDDIQRLAFHFLSIVAEPPARSRDGVVTLRKSRPRDHNDRARLLPLCRGILYLSSCVPVDIIMINSRLGNMPSVNTIKAALKGFSQQKAVVIRTRGRDITITRHADGRITINAKVLIFDNVQHFLRQRELRIGRENSMIIGNFGCFFEVEMELAALDPLDKRQQIITSRRLQITVDDLFGMIDQPHLKQIGVLQYLEALTNYIPETSIYKKDIYSLYRSLAKLQAVVEKMKVHTLASSGKNEVSIAELKDTFLDFLNQMGMTEDDYDFLLWFGGGDGMSFANMHILKKASSSFVPYQVWHLTWTYLCRISETHWGSPLNNNPVTLGHSTKKIGRAPPPNLKKVDYYPTAQFLALVHDMRMLDCWVVHFKTDDIFKYFAQRALNKTMPSFEDLHSIAKKIFETYTAPGARHQAGMDARDEAVAWTSHALLGVPWQPTTSSSAPPPKPKRKSNKKKPVTAKTAGAKAAIAKKNLPPPPPFFGDKVLADDGAFMYDVFINREVVAATAQGNVGRMWEALKPMVFTFAGSSHGKYTNYMLKMICDLELESSPALKDATLLTTVLSAKGQGGDFGACNIFQEWLNHCLDPIVQRKDADYGADHIREIWSRNIKDIHDLKKDYRDGVGLAKRSGKHKKPHERPEVKTLLHKYRTTQLHKRRPGRTFNDGRNVENFQTGVNSFQNGALQKWAKRTTNSRILPFQQGSSSSAAPDGSKHESDWSEDEDDEEEELVMTPGTMHYVDGQLVIELDNGEDNDVLTAMAMDDEVEGYE
ncbi:hypothetical protein C8R43DRAFT_952750 [Mycena crocata]|nr:hypothetical protein C8R43DRAFT_952750 [Mycena crocata]